MRVPTSLKAMAAAAAMFSFSQQASATTLVDLELTLLIDISGSISSSEYNLMMDGYGAAFRNATVRDKIQNGAIGAIAVNVIQFGTTSSGFEIDWTYLSDDISLDNFANALETLGRNNSLGSSTCVSCGLTNASARILADNGFDGTRLVIDVSGDGSDNVAGSAATQAARDAALAGGVDTINGITIGGGASLVNWYNSNVIGGTGAFVVGAANFAAFEQGIADKLIKEIDPPEIPLPATVVLAAAGFGMLGILGRRKKA